MLHEFEYAFVVLSSIQPSCLIFTDRIHTCELHAPEMDLDNIIRVIVIGNEGQGHLKLLRIIALAC